MFLRRERASRTRPAGYLVLVGVALLTLGGIAVGIGVAVGAQIVAENGVILGLGGIVAVIVGVVFAVRDKRVDP